MSTTRVFLLASSLARLIEKEREGRRIQQGYFPDRSERGTHVQVEGTIGHLILVTNGPHGPVEEATGIPLSHAETLLELTAGRVEYRAILLSMGEQRAAILRFISPGPLDMIAVSFEQDEQARRFQPLAWFGPEVTADPGYQTRSIAVTGLPAVPEVEASNNALNSLLDTLDNRLGGQQQSQPARAEELIAPQPGASAPSEVSSEDEDDTDDLAIEDSVIRELARSLRPRR
jgi:CYTH domain-containing protein